MRRGSRRTVLPGAYVPRLPAEVHGDTTFSNDNTEKTYASLAAPTNMAAGDRLVARFGGELLNNSGSGVTYTFKFKLGGTTIATSSAASFASNASARLWQIEAILAVIDPTNSQIASGFGIIGTVGNFQWNTGSAVVAVIQGTAAEDLTVAKNVILTVQMGTANASASVTLHQASLLHLPKA